MGDLSDVERDYYEEIEAACSHPREDRKYGSINQATEWCGRCGKLLYA